MNNYDLELMKDRVWEFVREQTSLRLRQITTNNITVPVAHRVRGYLDDGIRDAFVERMNA